MKVHHICIQTEVYEESLDFYLNILGFELVKESKNFHNRAYNSWLKLGDFFIELQTKKENEKLSKYEKNSEGIVHFCIFTDNIQDEYERIKNLGFNGFRQKKDEDIYRVEDGLLFKIEAPEGTIIEVRNTWDL